MPTGYIDLDDCDILRVSPGGVLVRWDDEEIWLPLSQVERPDRLHAGDLGVVVSIPAWLAKDRGIEVE